ncbi:uncharacterized protein J7T54_002981 [Emericellopsis cladophorae]|uniref:Uncharacterized protein n=1 Tax=Emericellopsis cladophorae TaxID=2686198 RepID=A0A9Q0BAI1_9HYPO|nr:uncharacterized protein J7T54_002981 [Emericellopsis cladophorae]KAI6778357.1 hypothetical protein J7T54_002981 [Emericellopsis cladophorae]
MNDGPDLLFGIDLGMSCTGVSYLNRTRGNNIVQIFKDWGGYRVEDKAPTRLKYVDNKGKPSSWGFKCENDHYGEVQEWFKTDFGVGPRDSDRQVEVRRLYTDYLECLYEQLRSEFPPAVLNGKHWDRTSIRFYFSVPATWDTAIVDEFCVLARRAGFGSQPGFDVKATLTEPHAVAAYTLSCEGFIEDLCFLNIDDALKGKISMRIQCGSTFIDSGFMELAKARLQPLAHILSSSIEDVAWQMMRGIDFQSNKKELGSGRWGDEDTFRIKIPNMPHSISEASLRVKDGDMQFAWSELRQIFDTQVVQMTRMLDSMMEHQGLRASPRYSQVNHVILSGGLGSSKYVQKEIFGHISKSKGDTINDSKSIRYPFSVEFGLELDPSHRRAQVPIMTSLRNPVPDFNELEVVRLHTTLDADLSQVGRGSIVKKNTIWSRGNRNPIVKVRFLIEAVVGIADVKFRCLDAETGKQISADAALPFQMEERAVPMPASFLVREDTDE